MRRRLGAVYVTVLMASLLVASFSIAAVQAAMVYARSLNEESDYARCQIAADAALEWAVARINASGSWRTSHVHNVDVPARVIAGASIRYRLIDSDGDLNDNPLDKCDLLVTASAGGARCCWRATLKPAGPALRCLSHALATTEDVRIEPSSVISTDGSVAAEKKVDARTDATLTGNCYTKNGTNGAIFGSIETLVGSLEVPDLGVIEHYTALGTNIDRGVLPVVLGRLQLKGHLLSQTVNSVSNDTNPHGVYVIDCGGNSILITESRLRCTLVLLQVGGQSLISDSVFWEAPQANYPALLVDGKMELRLSSSPLSEATVGRNLNPLQAPFRGVYDSDTATVYPSAIRGLIYVSQELSIDGSASGADIFGCIIGPKRLTVSGNVRVHYRDIFALDPPPGFGNYSLVRAATGTIRKVAAP